MASTALQHAQTCESVKLKELLEENIAHTFRMAITKGRIEEVKVQTLQESQSMFEADKIRIQRSDRYALVQQTQHNLDQVFRYDIMLTIKGGCKGILELKQIRARLNYQGLCCKLEDGIWELGSKGRGFWDRGPGFAWHRFFKKKDLNLT